MQHPVFHARQYTFDYIEDFDGAQKIYDSLDIKKIHRWLDELARTYCPVHLSLNRGYHWSIMQAEYATDIIFKNNPTCSRCIQS